MDEKKKSDANAKMDDFWDIDALIPQRRVIPTPTDTTTAEILLEPNRASEEVSETTPRRHFIPPHDETEARLREAQDEYVPENSLIKMVRIFSPKGEHRYYDSFLRDAERLHSVKGRECAYVAFFSYVPQYSQMERAQLEWYLWWRENFRNGVFLTTDYSYLLLYAYEMINLAETIGPSVAQEELCKLWSAYRELFHQLDTNLPEWICDLSLIHHLPPPDVFRENELYTAMSRCVLKEFYISAAGEDGLLRGLLIFCSNYDFRKSKFYTKETKLLFERTIFGASRYALEHMSESGSLLNIKGMDTSRMVRDSYNGALCAYRLRRRIAIEYNAFTRSNDLCYLITDIVKYTENQIRASLGIRSRLSIYALPSKIRENINTYLSGKLPTRPSTKRASGEEDPSYAALYDVPKRAFSKELAGQIERASWDTTEKLVEAFTEEANAESAMPTGGEEETRRQMADALEDAVAATEDAFLVAMKRYLPFLSAVFRRDVRGQRKCAEALQLSAELAAEAINEIAAEQMGDILIEEAENGYSVIEEYTDTVTSLLTAGNGGT